MNRFLTSALAGLAGLAVAPTEQGHRPFRLFGYGALGGARGSNPFPAPPAFNAHGGRHVPEPVTHRLVINREPQPWQKEAAKAKARAEKHPHMTWDARRVAREARNALAPQQAA